MPTANKGLHHFHIRKRIHQKHEPYPHPDRRKRLLDKIIYVVVVLGPVMNLPQLFQIWLYRNASGVSFISWSSFSLISVVWLIYGLAHKEKPIIIMNFFLMIIQALIALGTLMYG